MIYYFHLLFLLHVVRGLFFELADFEKIHFVEDVPDSTTVVGNYVCELKNPESGLVKPSRPGTCVHVQIHDPFRKLILSKVYGGEGQFYFRSSSAGEHFIGLSLPTPLKYETNVVVRIHLSIVSGEGSLDYPRIARQEKLSELEMKYRRLIEQARDIQKEQSYQRVREMRYRGISDYISHLVLAFALGQLCLLIIVTVVQTKHLKLFFKQKKLL